MSNHHHYCQFNHNGKSMVYQVHNAWSILLGFSTGQGAKKLYSNVDIEEDYKSALKYNKIFVQFLIPSAINYT